MKYYAVFDTNVLVSSFLTKNADSATVRVVDAIADEIIVPLYNAEILAEYDEVLHRDKFPFHEESITAALNVFRQFGVEVTPSPTGETLPDMDDLVFYEVTMEKRGDDAYLITGNLKHFPKRSYIVTPNEMMKIIDGNAKE